MLTFSRTFVLVLLLSTIVAVPGYGSNSTLPGDSSSSFNITSPKGSVTWVVGQTVNISWSVPSDVPSQYTAPDGYGCNVALFNSSDHSALLSYISQSAVFSTGSLSWTIPSNFVPTTTYVVGVGFNNYVAGDAVILIVKPNTTPSVSSSTSSSVPVPVPVSVSTSASLVATSPSLPPAHSSSSTPTQQAKNETASPAQFLSVGGVGGLIGIVTGSTLIVGGILGIMSYNSCRERRSHFPASSRYGGEGSSYVPRSDETYSYANDHDGSKAPQATSPPTSPNLGATNVSSPSFQAAITSSASNRSTYIPFSKRNPNPHHDNVDLLPVDPFTKPVPAYILSSDSMERSTDRQQRGGKSRRPSEPEESRPYNFI